jgi:hypothetical protein
MLLIGKRLIIFYLILSFTAQISMAVFYYRQLAHRELTIKYVTHIAESLLFVNLVLAFVFLIIGIYIPLYSKSIDKELDKLGEASERGNYNARRAVYNLGSIGQRINRIIRQVSRLSELRHQHIISLIHLLEYSSAASENIYFICDIEGTVKFMSKGALDYYKTAPLSAQNKIMVSSLIENINYSSIIKQFSRRNPWVSGHNFSIYAAFDNNDIPHYLFFTPEQSPLSAILKEKIHSVFNKPERKFKAQGTPFLREE